MEKPKDTSVFVTPTETLKIKPTGSNTIEPVLGDLMLIKNTLSVIQVNCTSNSTDIV